MSLVLPTLFAFATAFSLFAIWNAVAAHWNTVLDLHRRIKQPECGAQIVVTLRDDAGELDALSGVRRPRQVRVPAPKPVTHRLHHFARHRSVA